MFVSKHHYAIELAKKGNTVYFLNPPVLKKKKPYSPIEIVPVTGYDNLYLITNTIDFPYNIKFHWARLFHFLIRKHTRLIQKSIGKHIDIIWSFDLANVYPLKFFLKTAISIFHPVDDPLNNTGIDAARDADYIFSTANEILDKYDSYNVPKHFINHGIAEEFIVVKKQQKTDDKIRIGFSGNLLREDIDRKVLLQIINENQDCIFECWGSYEMKDANIGGGNDACTINFISSLKGSPNVILHGAVSTVVLANEFQRMDTFLICYDLSVENRNGPNYHKILEYISTGKIIVSNYISVYQDKPQFIQMVKDASSNNELPNLFKTVLRDLSVHNSEQLQKERMAFAIENTYVKQLTKIEKILSTK